MTTEKIIEILAKELVDVTGLDKTESFSRIIHSAVVAGIEIGLRDSSEVVIIDRFGHELDVFKNVNHASYELGISTTDINNVLNGLAHTAGGFKFIRRRNLKQIKL